MGYFVTAFVCALIGGAPFDAGKRGWLVKWLSLTGGLTLLWWLSSYLGLPQLVGPFWGAGVTWMIILGLWLNVFIRLGIGMADEQFEGLGLTVLAVGAITLVFMGRGCEGCGAFNADGYRSFVQDNVTESNWTEDVSEIDTARIRTVSEVQARRFMGISLGEARDTSLGSKYQIGNLTIQRMGEDLVWVAPLEFTGFRSWHRYGTTAGYLIVDATNAQGPARLVDDRELRYMPSAYFGDNLQRRIYENGYRFRGYEDFTFELDDEGNPYWVVTLYTPTISYWGERIDGVLVVNPTTGEMNEYSGDSIPSWVDRVVPQRYAFERLTNYGQYVRGWWNSVWAKEGVRVPTQPEGMGDMWLVWGSDNQAYWFTGLTSINRGDNSLVGFALMDSRTGATRTYRASGSDEVDIVNAVNSKVSNYSGYLATQPILYNIYGEQTWAVPVTTNEGVFQRLALAHGETGQVVIGENRGKALANYRRLLAQSGNRAAPTATADAMVARGVVERFSADVRDGNTTYYLVLACDAGNCGLARSNGEAIDNPREVGRIIFTGTSELSPELPLAREGDEVEVQFLETTESQVPLTAFDLLDMEASD